MHTDEELAEAITVEPSRNDVDTNNVRIGTIESLSPLSVSLQGGEVATPGQVDPGADVGDPVLLLRQGSTWALLGRTTAAPAYRSRILLTATTPSVTFNNIPPGLRSLRLRYRTRCDNAGTVLSLFMRVNGNAGGIYGYENIIGQGAALAASLTAGATSAFVGRVAGAGSTAGIFAEGTVDFNSWDQNANPLYLGVPYSYRGGSFTAGGVTDTGHGFITLLGPYTSITLFPSAGNWVAGCDFQLYGEPT